MNDLGIFLSGVAVIPAALGLWWLAGTGSTRLRRWYTRPIDLAGKTLAYRRALIVGLTLELLDATHVRAIRLPFNRVFVIRSNPRKEYDFVGQKYVVIGGDFENAEQLIGKALDDLGYALQSAECEG
ncbi:hypothetical protein ACNQVK_00540 [Mycobacterium sp. 134]|uniref:hypothetical protein n=1 Tax=Mycobacterium sp. 134 TaxID=3400425 RepID=UPI003AB079B2